MEVKLVDFDLLLPVQDGKMVEMFCVNVFTSSFRFTGWSGHTQVVTSSVNDAHGTLYHFLSIVDMTVQISDSKQQLIQHQCRNEAIILQNSAFNSMPQFFTFYPVMLSIYSIYFHSSQTCPL